MTDRFFVSGGSDDDYNGADNWSGSSGGGGGAGVPVTTDNAFFDGNSPTTCTIDANVNCRGLDASAWATGVFDFSAGFYLRTYGDVDIAVGVTAFNNDVEGGELIIYSDIGGGNIDFHDGTWDANLAVGETQSDNRTWFNDLTVTGKILEIKTYTSTGDIIVNGDTGTEKIIFNPTTGGDYYTHTKGTGASGNIRGDMRIEFIGTVNFHMNASSVSYGTGLKYLLSAGTTTIFGYNNTNDCGVHTGFEFIKTGGTLLFDTNTPIPRFVMTTTAGTCTLDFSTDAPTYDLKFGSGNTNFIINSTGIDIIDHVVYQSSGEHIIENNNARLTINDCGHDDDVVVNSERFFLGDTGIDFIRWFWQYSSTSSSILRWKENLTYTFQERFIMWNADTGIVTLRSDHATLRTKFHFYHNCAINIAMLDFIRIDALSVGQQLYCGQQPIITDCVGVKNEEVARAIQTGDGTDHPFYTDQIFDPVTVSGTVELSASPQTGARVHVITMQTEDGKDWFMLRHILTTNGSGEWTCSVPRNSTVFVSAHYDSGGTLYNSLSKPFIDAS